MKAICGYWVFDGAPAPDGTLNRMRIARVRCEAPNLEEWRDGPIAFGSAWWSPQPDLAPPQCIARHPETGCVVIADARLDNPAELRAALGFPAPSDAPDAITDHATKLILDAWLRWSEDCVDRIDGDFTFAVFDPRKQQLFLARDRMGERPLYVHHVPGKLLVFGSTSYSVLAHPRVPKDINEVRIADYLLECVGGGLEGVDFTSTFFTAIERHPPRHVRTIDAQGERLRQYWTLEPGRAGPLPRTDDEWVEALTAAMERAVAQCLAGPGRVGSMLSGGLDSTSLAIIAGEQLQAAGRGHLPTFSAIDSSHKDCLETRAVRIATQMPIFQPTLIDIANLGELQEELQRFLAEFDEPFDASMALIDAQYAAAANGHMHAIMDGGNGDSLFLPTGVMQRQIRSGHWQSAWTNAKGLTRYGGSPWQHLRAPLRAALVPDWLRRWLAPVRRRKFQKVILRCAYLSDNFAARVQAKERLMEMRSLNPASAFDAQKNAQAALLHTFPTVGAERYHRVAARHGITPLAPFSERKLLELCVHLPDEQRLRNGWTKFILRQIMSDRMPEAVRLRHDKQHLGWRLTRHLWDQRNDLKTWPEIATGPLAGYLNPQFTATEASHTEHRWPRHLLHAAILEHCMSKNCKGSTIDPT